MIMFYDSISCYVTNKQTNFIFTARHCYRNTKVWRRKWFKDVYQDRNRGRQRRRWTDDITANGLG